MRRSSLSLLTCFVIGPIGDRRGPRGSPLRLAYDTSLETFHKVIVAACSLMGIQPMRADQIGHAGDIPEQVFVRLRDSDLVIADLSGANPNVMYELGLRHAIGRLTIQIAERGSLPFDVTTIRTILFDRTRSGYARACVDLRKYIRSACDAGLPPLPATRIFRHSDAVIKPAQIAISPKTASLYEISLFIDESFRLSAAEYQILADCTDKISDVWREIIELCRGNDELAFSKSLLKFNQRVEPILRVIREQCLSLETIRDRIDRALQIGLTLADKVGRDSLASLKDWRRMLRRRLASGKNKLADKMAHREALEKSRRSAPGIIAAVLDELIDLWTRSMALSTEAPTEWIRIINATIKRIQRPQTRMIV